MPAIINPKMLLTMKKSIQQKKQEKGSLSNIFEYENIELTEQEIELLKNWPVTMKKKNMKEVTAKILMCNGEKTDSIRVEWVHLTTPDLGMYHWFSLQKFNEIIKRK